MKEPRISFTVELEPKKQQFRVVLMSRFASAVFFGTVALLTSALLYYFLQR